MKFDDKQEVSSMLIKSEYLGSCMVCGQPTHYLDCICEGRLCSDECSDAFYKMVEQQEI